jgi:hypothetical protein
MSEKNEFESAHLDQSEYGKEDFTNNNVSVADEEEGTSDFTA